MASYRFCRPDDLPLLVQAVNDCFNPHFPDRPTMTVERFRQEMKERDVWPSNSMVAMGGPGGREPIAVSIGTKRAHEVLVDRVGIRSDYLRQGHGGHLVTSLSQKLAVLGPERLVAEVPLDNQVSQAFFAAQGYEREATYTDFHLGRRAAAAIDTVPEGLVSPMSIDELGAADAFVEPQGVAWDRSAETLRASRDALKGLAIVTPDRVEAYLLYRSGETADETGADRASAALHVVALQVADADQAPLFSELLLRASASLAPRVDILRLAADEIPRQTLETLGFEPRAQYARLAARARPL